MPARKPKDLVAAELKAETARKAKIENDKKVGRRIYPVLEGMKTVYDAQTVVQAVSGHLQFALVKKQQALQVRDVMDDVDLVKGKETDTKKAVEAVLALIQDEGAEDMQRLMEAIGNQFSKFLAHKHMNDPMTEVKVDEFIAK